MSIEIINTVIENAEKYAVERTWRGEQFTEFQSLKAEEIDLVKYRAVVHRERITTIDVEGMEPLISRRAIPPFVGEPAEGTDGTQPEHYADAVPGFNPRIETDMAEITDYADTETVTVAGVTIPAKIVPLLLQATYDLVAQKHQQKQLEQAIQTRIGQIEEESGDA